MIYSQVSLNVAPGLVGSSGGLVRLAWSFAVAAGGFDYLKVCGIGTPMVEGFTLGAGRLSEHGHGGSGGACSAAPALDPLATHREFRRLRGRRDKRLAARGGKGHAIAAPPCSRPG